MTISEYQINLAEQARGAYVPTQRTIPVVLYLGESEDEDDSTFIRWAHQGTSVAQHECPSS